MITIIFHDFYVAFSDQPFHFYFREKKRNVEISILPLISGSEAKGAESIFCTPKKINYPSQFYLQCPIDHPFVQTRASRGRVRETARRVSACQTIKIRHRAIVVRDEIEGLRYVI